MHLITFLSRPRTLAAATACAAALAAAVALLATSSPAAALAGSPRCPTSGLVVWLDTQGNGAAGSIFYKLELTNLSGHTCTLKGFPGVSAVSLTGRQLGSAASRTATLRPRLVRLANGATAVAVLRIVNVHNFPPAACRPVTAAGLRVFPPSQTASKVVPFPFGACSRTGPVYLSVGAVR